MPKVLLIDSDLENLVMFRKLLLGAGFEVTVARSGCFALTMVEWDRPDLIVSKAQVQDMDGYELCSIVRSDPATREIPFLLLATRGGPAPGAAAKAGVDMTLVGEHPLPTVLAKAQDLLRRNPPAAQSPARGLEGAASKASGRLSGRTLQGSLGVLDLMEVVQAMSLGRKTGRLWLSLAAGEGFIAFEIGRVVHAEFGAWIGEKAFAVLISESQGEIGVSFCFEPVESKEAGPSPKTIYRSVEQLLLNAATEIDERRVPSGGFQEVGIVPAPREAA